MNAPFDLLNRILTWAHAKSRVFGFLVSMLIIALAIAAQALLNQDGTSQPAAAARDAATAYPHESNSGAPAPRTHAQLGA